MVYDPPKSSGTWGKKPFDTEGPFKQMTRRIDPGLYTDADRAYRARWMKAQQLSSREQGYHLFLLWDNPDYRKARLNPIR